MFSQIRSEVMVSVTACLLLVLVACAQGYDEAGCNSRSNKTYYSGINGICRLPLGGCLACLCIYIIYVHVSIFVTAGLLGGDPKEKFNVN